jgi:hypothetical protein
MSINDVVSDSGSLKRLGTFALTSGVIAVNKKLDLGLEAGDIAALVALALGYITQSMVHEKAKLAGEQAAAAVVTTKDAAAVLGGEVQK